MAASRAFTFRWPPAEERRRLQHRLDLVDQLLVAQRRLRAALSRLSAICLWRHGKPGPQRVRARARDSPHLAHPSSADRAASSPDSPVQAPQELPQLVPVSPFSRSSACNPTRIVIFSSLARISLNPPNPGQEDPVPSQTSLHSPENPAVQAARTPSPYLYPSGKPALRCLHNRPAKAPSLDDDPLPPLNFSPESPNPRRPYGPPLLQGDRLALESVIGLLELVIGIGGIRWAGS